MSVARHTIAMLSLSYDDDILQSIIDDMYKTDNEAHIAIYVKDAVKRIEQLKKSCACCKED